MTKAPKKKRERFKLPPRMAEDELEAFVKQYLAGLVTSSAEVPPSLYATVFLPIAFGALSGATKAQLKKIGLIYAVAGEDKTVNMGVNGFPIYFSSRLMLKADWDIARATIKRELEAPTRVKLAKP